MNRRTASLPPLVAAVLLVAAALLLARAGGASSVGSSSRRGTDQVILISLDTLRQDHLSVYGYPRPTTPNLARFARDAAVFEQAQAQAPFTLPSHMSMLTGLQPGAHQVRLYDDVLAESFVTLAESLQEAGFETAAFTDGGFVSARFGFAQGFDRFEDGRVVGTQQVNGFRRFGPDVRCWVSEHRDRPFFLFVHSFDTHGPYWVEPEYRRYLAGTRPVVPAGASRLSDPMAYMRALGVHDYYQLDQYDSLAEMIDSYDAAIRYVDERVGELLGLLRSLDLYDSSLIIVTSDHGEAFLDHGIYTGHGLTLYEEELRVPLLVKYPRGRFAGVRSSDVVRLIDLFPTVTAATGVRCPPEVQGVDLSRALADRDPEPRVAIGENPNLSRTEHGRIIASTCSLRRGDLKIIETPTGDIAHHLNVRRGSVAGDDLEADLAHLEERVRRHAELYNLARDPREEHDLSRQNRSPLPALRARLRLLLAQDHLLFNSKQTGAGSRARLSDEEIEILSQQGYLKVERAAGSRR